MEKQRGNTFFGFVVGSMITCILIFSVSSFFDIRSSQDAEMVARGALVAANTDAINKLDIGFNNINQWPEIEVLYKYENGDIIIRTITGQVIWIHFDENGMKKCMGGSPKDVPSDCR